MEHGDQERDSLSQRYNQESSTRLPLAPLVSTPSGRRRDATVSTRRGISIFSPMQTLDQLRYEENPAQDPDPTTAKAGGASSSKAPAQPPLPQESPQSPPADASTTFNSIASVTYRECRKNHAAGTGNHAVDGCREFMPSGEDGTQESLKCAACDCHRNFHRKEIASEPEPSRFLALPTLYRRQNPATAAASESSPHLQLHFATIVAPMRPTMMNSVGNGGGGAAESSDEYLGMFQSCSGGHALMQTSSSGSKKRFRTKFDQEQKDRMHEFATKLGWRIQNDDDEEEVQKFCSEIGVKRQVFKVWMHNNKKRQN